MKPTAGGPFLVSRLGAKEGPIRSVVEITSKLLSVSSPTLPQHPPISPLDLGNYMRHPAADITDQPGSTPYLRLSGHNNTKNIFPCPVPFGSWQGELNSSRKDRCAVNIEACGDRVRTTLWYLRQLILWRVMPLRMSVGFMTDTE